MVHWLDKDASLEDQQMALKLSLACVVTTLFLGIVVANALALSPKKPVQPTGWVTTVFKNPH